MSTCPPGVICINHYNALGLIVIAILVIYIINKEYYKPIYKLYKDSDINNNHNHNIENIDRKLIEDNLYPPLSRNYYTDSKSYDIINSNNGLHKQIYEHENVEHQKHEQHSDLNIDKGPHIHGLPTI